MIEEFHIVETDNATAETALWLRWRARQARAQMATRYDPDTMRYLIARANQADCEAASREKAVMDMGK